MRARYDRAAVSVRRRAAKKTIAAAITTLALAGTRQSRRLLRHRGSAAEVAASIHRKKVPDLAFVVATRTN